MVMQRNWHQTWMSSLLVPRGLTKVACCGDLCGLQFWLLSACSCLPCHRSAHSWASAQVLMLADFWLGSQCTLAASSSSLSFLSSPCSFGERCSLRLPLCCETLFRE
ncbi:hypothetical protein U0070_008227 [Myodes glareolus]|uniref:Secreted protein n=1 Tax=Myodes glareolus TaxID=447135 RepID=A0AAW0I8B1_MYOGA